MLYPHPILRLTIPVAAGIFFTGCFPGCVPVSIWWVLTLMGGIGLGVLLFWHSPKFRTLFGGGAMLVCFSLGCLLMEHYWQGVQVDWLAERQAYQATVSSYPVEKRKSVQVDACVDGKQVRLYLATDSAALSLSLGDPLLFYGNIEPPVNRGNPEEFDFERYCLLHGISGSAWIAMQHWKRLDVPKKLTWKQKALVIQQKVVQTYDGWNLGTAERAVLSALTIGDKRELDPTLRQEFSTAGIAHVLALSGMHIGIIWMLLDFLLFPLKKSSGGRWIKWLLTVSLLWSFAFVTGLQPSVIRAVVMCMLMDFARMVHRPLLSLNTLGMAALVMLVANPANLFDVGFQLSFVAVASIFLLYTPFYQLLPRMPRWLKPIWSVVCVSVAAQLGTAPLAMYYFSQFSVYFLLTNLIASLLVPLIIYGCALTWFFFFLPCVQGTLSEGLQWLIYGLNLTANTVSHLPGAQSIDYQPYEAEVWLFYVFLLLVYVYLHQPIRKHLFLVWGAGLSVCLLHVVLAFPQKRQPEMIFYHLPACSAVHLIEPDGRSYLASNRPDTVLACMESITSRFWKKEKLQAPILLMDAVHQKGVVWQHQLLSWRGLHIGVFTDHSWRAKTSEKPFELDYALIGRGFKGDLSSLLKVFAIHKVVLDATLFDSQIERLKTECELLHIPCVNLSEEGSYRIPL